MSNLEVQKTAVKDAGGTTRGHIVTDVRLELSKLQVGFGLGAAIATAIGTFGLFVVSIIDLSTS